MAGRIECTCKLVGPGSRTQEEREHFIDDHAGVRSVSLYGADTGNGGAYQRSMGGECVYDEPVERKILLRKLNRLTCNLSIIDKGPGGLDVAINNYK